MGKNTKFAIFKENLFNYAKKEFNYKRILDYSSYSNTILINMKKIDIYLRLGKTPTFPNENVLLIKRIGFYDLKKGHGTRLLNFLLTQRHLLDFKYIEIESVNGASIYFSKKYNFSLTEDHNNCYISVEELEKNLSKKKSKSNFCIYERHIFQKGRKDKMRYFNISCKTKLSTLESKSILLPIKEVVNTVECPYCKRDVIIQRKDSLLELLNENS